MKTYKVEMLRASTKAWENQVTFKPDYVMSIMSVKWRWWFPFKRIEYGLIANLRAAEAAALEKAMYHAKIMAKKGETKVIVDTQVSGSKTSETVWQNGKLLTPPTPLWRRLLSVGS